MSLIDTRTMLQELGSEIASLTWQPSGDPLPAAEPLFESVAFFDSGRLEDALAVLFDFSGSMAVIVPAADRFRCKDAVTSLKVAQVVEIDIYLTGRSFDPTSTVPEFLGMLQQGGDWVLNTEDIGMIGRKDALVAGIAGWTGSLLYRPLEPVSAVPLTLAGDSGLRKSYLITVRAEADDASFPVRSS
jgi:hypothetical protein